MKERPQHTELRNKRMVSAIENTARYLLSELQSTEVATYGSRLSKVGAVIQQVDRSHYFTALSMAVLFNHKQGLHLAMLGVERMLKKRTSRESQEKLL